MLDAIYRTAKRFSGGRWVILFGVLFIAAMLINVGKPFGIAQLEEITDGVGALDVEMFATAEHIYDILDKQGEAGRAFYRRLLLTTEVVFPLVYRIFNVLFLAFLFGRWIAPDSRWNKLCLLPLVGMIADYIENALVLTMLFSYPQRLYGMASVVGVVTTIKWLSNYTDWCLMAVGLLGLVLAYMLRRRQRSG
jgi:uncharacterized membrane protein HdeD (DUF308 family)